MGYRISASVGIVSSFTEEWSPLLTSGITAPHGWGYGNNGARHGCVLFLWSAMDGSLAAVSGLAVSGGQESCVELAGDLQEWEQKGTTDIESPLPSVFRRLLD